jgi:hypothetical protein
MSNFIYVSRNFVEFGAFKSEEIADFKQRGIITNNDYLRVQNTNEWIPAVGPSKVAASTPEAGPRACN